MYIKQSILETNFGVPTESIKTSTKRYRQGKSQSWANIKDPNDKRRVLIDIDTIPEPTRKKYNIPTGREYHKQKELQRQAEQEAELHEQKLQAEQFKKDRLNIEKSALYNAYNNDFMQYLQEYKDRYSHNKVGGEMALISAKEHAFWVKMLEITGNKHKSFDGGCKRGFGLYLELKMELVLYHNFANENVFRTLISKLRKTALKSGTIADIVANNKCKPKGVKKTSDIHRGYAMAFLSHPNKYCYRVATDLVNHHCTLDGIDTISESWIKWLMTNDNHFKTLVKASRNGEKYLKDSLLPHAVRKNTPYPANVWMLDGSPLQFYCWNESRTKQVRLNLFVIIDVCSRKIVGFDVSYSEDKFNIMNALKMAVRDEGHLPAEIVSDNFSASKTQEIKALVQDMAKVGTVWRHAKVGNPQDKSYVERFFGSFQSVECALYDDYIGEGIMSKRDNRRAVEQLLKTAKTDGLPSYNKMKDKVIEMIIKYNSRVKPNRKAPKEVYKLLPKPNAKELDSLRTALLFWTRTKATIRNSMVKIVVKEQEHFFRVKDHEISTRLFGKQVFVRYDEKDLDSVMLFDLETETVICECKKVIMIETGHVDRTDEDNENLYKVSTIQKSNKDYLEKAGNKIVQGVFKGVNANKESIETAHPLNLAKNQINDLEDLALQERMREYEGIPKEDQEETRTKPLGTIYNEASKSNYTYEDRIVNKKPPKEGSLKVVKPTDN